ncbi:hypothetical protein HDV02_004696, partial [Globomyces sp. JEL0801]
IYLTNYKTMIAEENDEGIILDPANFPTEMKRTILLLLSQMKTHNEHGSVGTRFMQMSQVFGFLGSQLVENPQKNEILTTQVDSGKIDDALKVDLELQGRKLQIRKEEISLKYENNDKNYYVLSKSQPLVHRRSKKKDMSYRPPKPRPLNIIRKTPAADEDELDDADKIQELEDEAVKVAAKALRDMNTSSEMDMMLIMQEKRKKGFEKQTAEDMDFIDDEPVHNQASYRDFPEEESNQPIILKVGSEIEDDLKASVGPKLFALTTSLKTKMLDLVAKKAMEDENQMEASNEQTVVIDDVFIPNDQVPEPIQWIEVTDANSAFDLVKERMKYFVTQDDMLSRGADLIRNRKYLNALRMVVTIDSYISHRKDCFRYEKTQNIVVEQAGSQQIIKDSTTRSVLINRPILVTYLTYVRT